MINTFQFHLTDGLNIRPARDSDTPFIESLYHSTRDDFRSLDAELDFIEALIEQQQEGAQVQGYGEQFPNAFYLILEKQAERIGCVVLDFAKNEIRIIDIVLIPEDRGKGYGTSILYALKYAAGKVCMPLVLSVYKTNHAAKRLYVLQGFAVEQCNLMVDQMVWYPTYFS
jgi:ribosomal protein S18 acetylase RimI-like enzyme